MAYLTEEQRRAMAKTFLQPTQGRVSSGFGNRNHPILGYRKMHTGMDIAAPTGTPIYASSSGTVTFAGPKGGYGNYAKIDHGDDTGRNYQTAYAHMAKFAPGIKKGTPVTQGQLIGYVGSTGNSTGPHLHNEVLRDGEKINPQLMGMVGSTPTPVKSDPILSAGDTLYGNAGQDTLGGDMKKHSFDKPVTPEEMARRREWAKQMTESAMKSQPMENYRSPFAIAADAMRGLAAGKAQAEYAQGMGGLAKYQEQQAADQRAYQQQLWNMKQQAEQAEWDRRQQAGLDLYKQRKEIDQSFQQPEPQPRPMTPEEKASWGIREDDPSNYGIVDGGKPFVVGGRASETNVTVGTGENAYKKKMGENAASIIMNDWEATQNAAGMTDKIKMLESLLGDVPTGTIPALVSNANKLFGLNLSENSGKYAAIEALQNQLIKDMRVPGSGPETEGDAKRNSMAISRLSNTPEGNRVILQFMRAGSERKAKVNQLTRTAMAQDWTLEQYNAERAKLPDPYDVIKKYEAEKAKGDQKANPAFNVIPGNINTIEEAEAFLQNQQGGGTPNQPPTQQPWTIQTPATQFESVQPQGYGVTGLENLPMANGPANLPPIPTPQAKPDPKRFSPPMAPFTRPNMNINDDSIVRQMSDAQVMQAADAMGAKLDSGQTLTEAEKQFLNEARRRLMGGQ